MCGRSGCSWSLFARHRSDKCLHQHCVRKVADANNATSGARLAMALGQSFGTKIDTTRCDWRMDRHLHNWRSGDIGQLRPVMNASTALGQPFGSGGHNSHIGSPRVNLVSEEVKLAKYTLFNFHDQQRTQSAGGGSMVPQTSEANSTHSSTESEVDFPNRRCAATRARHPRHIYSG